MTIDIKYDILMKSMKIFSPKGKNIMLELVNVSYYKAPKTRISPIIIQNGYEYVEILTGGKLLFENEGQEEVFEYGTMFWHIPGDHTIHRYLPDFPYECLCLRFKRPNKSTERIFPRVAIWENREEVLSFSDKVINAFHDESFNHQLISQYVFSKISWEAALFMKRKSSADIPASLAKLTSLIETAYTEDLTIEDLAKAAGISVPHLHFLSRKHLGISPHLILLNRRLQEARRLLATTNNEVKTISADCGFMNVETFCRAFRKKYQASPGEFRKSNSPKHILRGV